MPKPFIESFEEWVADNRYRIGEDVGWEFMDNKESGPMPEDSSLANQENGSETSEQKIINRR